VSVVVALVLLLLVAAVAVAWLLPSGSAPEMIAVGVLLGGLAGLGLLALLDGPIDDSEGLLPGALIVPMAAVAVLGGGPVTATVLRLADQAGGPEPTGVQAAASVLRGGAWIGAFERVGVLAALVAGWPEGIAVVLGLKGLGRYSELKTDGSGPSEPPQGGVAERFIIGTFCSVLWAVGWAGVYAGLRR
jgi:hypothetical protein